LEISAKFVRFKQTKTKGPQAQTLDLTKEKVGGQKRHNFRIKPVQLHGCSESKYPET
jgi:hypothetical protein